MRGIGYTLSRLPSARALLAGAAILAGAFVSAAHGQVSGSTDGNGTQATDETRAEEAALAIPRPPHGPGAPVAMPRPLRPSDAAIMRRIFAMQSRGNIPEAIRAVDQLEDPLILGSALADRYLGRFHNTTQSELADWLSHYGDHADAPSVYALFQRKFPKAANLPPAPNVPVLNRVRQADPAPEDMDPPRNDLQRDPRLDKLVTDHAERGNVTAALKVISARQKLSPGYAAQLRAEVAQVRFIHNDDAEALRIAQAALRDLDEQDRPALAGYVGGLAAWRLDRLDIARGLFESAAAAAITTPRLQAASAFWASRASRRMRDAAATVKWLRVAAEQPVTLHGLLARYLLRMPTGIVPSDELIGQADIDAIGATPGGWRAFALLQVGELEKAEAEFRALWPAAHDQPAFARSLLMVVSAAGLTDCAAQMAELLQAEDGLRHDEMRFPLPRLRPAGGFRIDPALVYALTRVESNFRSDAVSPAGARGLMQIMPATAQFIMGEPLYDAGHLHEPATNLEIGQRYVGMLAKQDGIDGDLLRMLASYNCGPGSFLRWSADIRDDGDPLMFMEAVPIPETRAFVQQALVYSWIYAARLHRTAPSLDSIAAGEFPRFTGTEQERRMASLAPGLN